MGAREGLYMGSGRVLLLLPNSQVGESSLAANYLALPFL